MHLEYSTSDSICDVIYVHKRKLIAGLNGQILICADLRLSTALRTMIRLLSAIEQCFCLSPSPDKQKIRLCVFAVKSPNPNLCKSALICG